MTNFAAAGALRSFFLGSNSKRCSCSCSWTLISRLKLVGTDTESPCVADFAEVFWISLLTSPPAPSVATWLPCCPGSTGGHADTRRGRRICFRFFPGTRLANSGSPKPSGPWLQPGADTVAPLGSGHPAGGRGPESVSGRPVPALTARRGSTIVLHPCTGHSVGEYCRSCRVRNRDSAPSPGSPNTATTPARNRPSGHISLPLPPS